jgi:hypothetical protein
MMMKRLCSALMIMAFATAGSLAIAQPSTGKPEARHPPMRDCSKITEADRKARCESRQKAMAAAQEKCKGLEPAEHRKCMKEQMPKKAN